MRAFLTISISKFKKTIGCCTGEGTRSLNQENIGKIFSLEILDPIKIGKAIYRGDGMTLIQKIDEFPKPAQYLIFYYIRKAAKEWAVFEKKIKEKSFFIVVLKEDVNVKKLPR
ncbi:MAG: hypothetical protein WC842_04045 [Candidatus Paceibacterota bacterium]